MVRFFMLVCCFLRDTVPACSRHHRVPELPIFLRCQLSTKSVVEVTTRGNFSTLAIVDKKVRNRIRIKNPATVFYQLFRPLDLGVTESRDSEYSDCNDSKFRGLWKIKTTTLFLIFGVSSCSRWDRKRTTKTKSIHHFIQKNRRWYHCCITSNRITSRSNGFIDATQGQVILHYFGMVRVNGAASASSSWTTSLSNTIAKVLSVVPFSNLHRRSLCGTNTSSLQFQRSKLGRVGRRGSGSRSVFSFACMTLAMLVTFAILQWYLLSFLAIVDKDGISKTANDENRNSNRKNYEGNDPLWTTCPTNSNAGDSDHKQQSGGGGDDICFVTCIFGDNIDVVDRPANVEWFDRYWCHTRFLLATNLPDLPAPGWTKIVANANANTNTTAVTVVAENSNRNNTVETTNTQKNIVQSRHAKFLAWEALPLIVPKHCATVVYMDGYLAPVRYTSWWNLLYSLISKPPWSPASPLFLGSFPWNHRNSNNQVPPPRKFQALIQQVRQHPWGLSQVKQKYFDGLPMTTLLNNLVRDRKDTKEHVENTLEWFRSQTTTGKFQEIMPYYLNKYFGK